MLELPWMPTLAKFYFFGCVGGCKQVAPAWRAVQGLPGAPKNVSRSDFTTNNSTSYVGTCVSGLNKIIQACPARSGHEALFSEFEARRTDHD